MVWMVSHQHVDVVDPRLKEHNAWRLHTRGKPDEIQFESVITSQSKIRCTSMTKYTGSVWSCTAVEMGGLSCTVATQIMSIVSIVA